MGFLMGAYGKLMAGRHLRDLQFQLQSVTRRQQRITKEIGEKTKLYEAQERNMKNQMQAQMQYGLFAYAQTIGLPTMMPGMGQAGLDMFGQQICGMMNYGAFNQDQMRAYSAMQMQMQMQYAQAQTMWQNVFEMQRQADLGALKDLEGELQIEKDSLESQIKIAQADYDSMKEMEKQGAQNLKPDYTGQA